MKASVFYRIAAVLLFLFAMGHTLGFRTADPKWGVDTVIAAMQSTHFDVLGTSRTYWELFEGAGFSVGVFFLFSAVLAWQLGGLPAATMANTRGIGWMLTLCYAVITFVSWKFLFVLPVVFSILITICLAAAAWHTGKVGSSTSAASAG